MTDQPSEKKIIIDEDWKSRVEAEREELAEHARKAPADKQEAPRSPAGGGGTMPPASLEMLLTTLATEAMIALGQVPHPGTGKQEVNLDQAKYFIDTLEVLETKTEGNLAPDEKQMLDNLLYQLRMSYLAAGSKPSPG